MGRQTSLVFELQQSATDRAYHIADLLRKALVVATKLGVDDFRLWIEDELDGYGTREVPDYRDIRCEVVAREGGICKPILFLKEPELGEKLSHFRVRESVASLSNLLVGPKQSTVELPLPSEVKIALLRGLGWDSEFVEPTRLAGRNRLEAIIDAVRTTVLRWALKLEQEGVLGEGMTFSDEEKRKAADNPQIHIGTFHGVLGDVYGGAVSQHVQVTINKGDFDSLRDYLKSVGVDDKDIDDLHDAIKADPDPAGKTLGARVGEWIGRMVTKAAQGLSQLPVGTASGLLANAIWKHYGL